jgi:hypothetical protein
MVIADIIDTLAHLTHLLSREINNNATNTFTHVLLLLTESFDRLTSQIDIHSCFVFLQVLDDEVLPRLEPAHDCLEALGLIQLNNDGLGYVIQ